MYDPHGSGLKEIIGEFYITGGFLRKKLMNSSNEDCDIDIISTVHEPYYAAAMVAKATNSEVKNGGFGSKVFDFGGRKYNILPLSGSLMKTLGEFDFTCCQVAMCSDGKLIVQGNAEQHIEDKRLVPTQFLRNTTDKKLAVRSWARMGKLIDEGFIINMTDLKDLCFSWRALMLPGWGINSEGEPQEGGDKIDF